MRLLFALSVVLSLGAGLAGTARATPSPVAAPFARPHRLGVSMGFGFGSAGLERVHALADEAIRGAAAPKSGLQINAEIGFRYYFPYFILAQVGYGAVYNRASEVYANVNVTNHNLIMEVPILVGGYYTFLQRLYVYAAAGPSVFFYPRVFWDPGTDFTADPGVGAHVVGGAEFMVGEHFAVGMELRYRYLKAGELMVKDTPIVYRNPAGQGYDIDLSGISLGIVLRFFAT